MAFGSDELLEASFCPFERGKIKVLFPVRPGVLLDQPVLPERQASRIVLVCCYQFVHPLRGWIKRPQAREVFGVIGDLHWRICPGGTSCSLSRGGWTREVVQ